MTLEQSAQPLTTHIRCVVPQEDGEIGCNSSDAMSVYYHPDNEKKKYQLKCFSCGCYQYLTEEAYQKLEIEQQIVPESAKRYKRDKRLTTETVTQPSQTDFIKGSYREDRGLTKETMEKFGVTSNAIQGAVARHIYPYYDAQNNLIAQKIRNILDAQGNPIPKGNDTFRVVGENGAMSKAMLFGQQLFPAGGAKILTIVEGEVDAMSAYQMMGSRYPVVSISLGAGSVKKLLANKDIYKYIDSFSELHICCDNDKMGEKAAEVLCEVFPSKAKIVPMALKDANEYLMKNKIQEFVRDAFWKAQPLAPEGLALSSEFMNDVMEAKVAKGAIVYPYPELNKKTFGMRLGEMTTWVAGTGSGKSTVQREIVNHIRNLTADDERIGMLMLEESPHKTATGLVGLQLKKPLLLWDLDQQLPPSERILKDLMITKEERLEAAKAILGGDRFVIMKNSFQGTDLANILKKVRQMRTVYNCKHIILDHISIIVSGQDNGDERKALDSIATGLRRITEELDINLHIVSHLKRPDGKGFEDGAEITLNDIRGTGAIGQLSDNVIALERNQQHDDFFIKNTIRFRVLKCRVTGLTGLAGYAYYNHSTGCVESLSNEDYNRYVESLEQRKETLGKENFSNKVEFHIDA